MWSVVLSTVSPSPLIVTVTFAIGPTPSTVTVPSMPAVRSSVPSKGTFAVSPYATVTDCDVTSKVISSVS